MMPKSTWIHRTARRFFSVECGRACVKNNYLRFGVASAAAGGLASISYLRHDTGLVFAESAAPSSTRNQRLRFYIPIFDRNRLPNNADEKNTEDNFDLHHLRLQNVQIFFRHGARTPLHTLETLPKEEQAVWHASMLGEPIRTMIKYDLRTLDGRSPMALADSPYDRDLYSKIIFPGGSIAGQMTMLGKMQTFHLGRQLRSHYINQLGLTMRTFSNNEVYVRSTFIKRTVESARCVVAGMFDLETGGETPIIHIATTEDEILYPNAQLCQAYKNATLDLFTNADEIPGLKDARKAVEELLGWSTLPPGADGTRKRLNFSDLRDIIVSQREHGLPIPQRLEAWTNRIEKFGTEMVLRYVVGLHLLNPDSVRRVLRVSCGPALHMMQQNIGHSLDASQPYYKLMLYSTHDSTLVALLCALGIFDNRWPPFAADLCIETYVDDATLEPWIRVMYMGNPMKLPGADGDFCSLKHFCKLLAPFTVTFKDYLKECDAQAASPR